MIDDRSDDSTMYDTRDSDPPRRRRRVSASVLTAAATVTSLSLVLAPAGPVASQDDGTEPEPSPSVVAAVVDGATGPTLSADGRWVVFGGLDGERHTVYRTDRASGETIELSPMPRDVPEGDTLHPRLSADGCVVVAVTEIAFDLFRDDDRRDRWDIYRLVVPECGGQPNG